MDTVTLKKKWGKLRVAASFLLCQMKALNKQFLIMVTIKSQKWFRFKTKKNVGKPFNIVSLAIMKDHIVNLAS